MPPDDDIDAGVPDTVDSLLPSVDPGYHEAIEKFRSDISADQRQKLLGALEERQPGGELWPRLKLAMLKELDEVDSSGRLLKRGSSNEPVTSPAPVASEADWNDAKSTSSPAKEPSAYARYHGAAGRQAAEPGSSKPEPSYEPPDPKGVQGNFTSRILPYWYEPAIRDTAVPGRPGWIERETPQTYQRRADAEWQQELDKAKREGYGVKRYKDEHSLLGTVAGFIPPAMLSVLYGASRGRLAGIPDAVGRVVGDAVDPGSSDRAEKIATGHGINMPGLGPLMMGTEVATALSPSSLSSKVVGGTMKVLGATQKGASLARAAAAIPAAAAADSVVRQGVQGTADMVQGKPLPSAQDVASEAGDAALYSLALAPPMMAAQAVGRGIYEGTRAHSKIGQKLRNVEASGGRTRFMRPIEPPPEIAEARALQQQPAPSVEEVAKSPEALERSMRAQDVSVHRARGELHRELVDHNAGLITEMGETNRAYEQSPEGLNTKLPVQGVVDRLVQRITSKTDPDGRALPNYELEADRQLLAEFLERIDDVNAPGPLPPDELARIREIDDGMGISETAADAAKRAFKETELQDQLNRLVGDKLPDRPAKNPQVELPEGVRQQIRPREISPSKLEGIISDYAEHIDFANKRGEKSGAVRKGVLPELYELRKQYPPNQVAPAEKGGFHGIKEDQARRMESFEDLLSVLNEDPQLKDVEVTDRGEIQALDRFVRNLRKDGVMPHQAVPALNEFIADKPKLARLLQVAIGHRDLDALEGLTTNPVKAVVRAGLSPTAYIRESPGAAAWLRLRTDPLMKAIGGIDPLAPPPSADGAIEDTRMFRAGRSWRDRKVSKEDVAGRVRDDLEHMPGAAKRTPNTLFDYYPDKQKGTGVSAGRAAKVGSVVGEPEHESDIRWLIRILRGKRKDATAVSGER